MNSFLTYILTGLILCSIGCSSSEEKVSQTTDTLSVTVPISHYTDLVDTRLGSEGVGLHFPAALVPFGMVQLGPDHANTAQGYLFADTLISGFSHTHKAGSDQSILRDFSFFPFVKKNKSSTSQIKSSSFSHTEEVAHPGFYGVTLLDFPVKVELSATARTGIQAYTFPESDSSYIRMDLTKTGRDEEIVSSSVEFINDTLFTGHREIISQGITRKIYFATSLSRKPEERVIMVAGLPLDTARISDRNLSVEMRFATYFAERLEIRTGVSFVNRAGAIANLQSEAQGKSFNAIVRNAREEWEGLLSRVHVNTSDLEKLERFYTALYHLCQTPGLISDADGGFRRTDGSIANSKMKQYGNFDLASSFSIKYPLLTLLFPEKMEELSASLLEGKPAGTPYPPEDLFGIAQSDEYDYPSSLILSSLSRKRDFREAWPGLADELSAYATQSRYVMNLRKKYQYLPSDLYRNSVSIDIRFSLYDKAIQGFVDQTQGDTATTGFSERPFWYRNHFDAKRGLLVGRNRNGAFSEPEPRDFEGPVTHQLFFPVFDSLFLSQRKSDGSLQKAVANLSFGDSISFFSESERWSSLSFHVPHRVEREELMASPLLSLDRIAMSFSRPGAPFPAADIGGRLSAWYVWMGLGLFPDDLISGRLSVHWSPFREVILRDSYQRVRLILTNSTEIPAGSIILDDIPLPRKHMDAGQLSPQGSRLRRNL